MTREQRDLLKFRISKILFFFCSFLFFTQIHGSLSHLMLLTSRSGADCCNWVVSFNLPESFKGVVKDYLTTNDLCTFNQNLGSSENIMVGIENLNTLNTMAKFEFFPINTGYRIKVFNVDFASYYYLGMLEWAADGGGGHGVSEDEHVLKNDKLSMGDIFYIEQDGKQITGDLNSKLLFYQGMNYKIYKEGEEFPHVIKLLRNIKIYTFINGNKCYLQWSSDNYCSSRFSDVYSLKFDCKEEGDLFSLSTEQYLPSLLLDVSFIEECAFKTCCSRDDREKCFCSDDSHCGPYKFCSLNTCRNKRIDSEDCSRNAECESGYCDVVTKQCNIDSRECISDSDCESTEKYCTLDSNLWNVNDLFHCRYKHNINQWCGDSKHCKSNVCKSGICGCKVDEECEVAEYCALDTTYWSENYLYTCVECALDVDCNAGEYCRNNPNVWNDIDIFKCSIKHSLTQWCADNRHCESGICFNGECALIECQVDSDCDNGEYCRNNPNIWNEDDIHKCSIKHSLTQWCGDDNRHCESGLCKEGLCRNCEADAHCGAGEYCRFRLDIWQVSDAFFCKPKHSQTQWCGDNRHCASGNCASGNCS